jgi:hypothetical protein
MGTADARHDAPEAAGYRDAVIDAYKAGIDRTLLCENLKPTAEERIRKLEAFLQTVQELQRAGRDLR